MALMVSNEQFAQIKDNKIFSDILFADLQVRSWFLPAQFHISNCAFRNCFLGNEVNFHRGVFKNVTFQDCEFEGVNFESLILTNTEFHNCKFRGGCVFNLAMFNNCKFNNCFIVGTDFSNAQLIGTTFNRGSFVYNNIDGLKYHVTGDLFNNIEEYLGNTGNIKRI